MVVVPATPTKIEIARRRARVGRRGLVLGSALAFGATVGLAKASHPATAHTSSTTSSSTSTSSSAATTSSSSQTSSGFGQASVSPSTSSQTPSVSTGTS